MRRDIDEALRSWPQEPKVGEIFARSIHAHDGRRVLQIRLELGLLQMEIVGRPDGTRPLGFNTYLDFLHERARRHDALDPWRMGPGHCEEVDREFAQYTHRRMAWLALRDYPLALRDAEHSLAIVDFTRLHGPDHDYIARQERLRGLVLYHHTQASVAIALRQKDPSRAITLLLEGIIQIQEHSLPAAEPDERAWPTDGLAELHENLGVSPNAPADMLLLDQLRRLEREIRSAFPVGKSLGEQLDEAIQREDYEAAARLRDALRSRQPDDLDPHHPEP